MLLNSVNTNVSAATALRQLGGTERELAVTRGRVSTGLRVASARDNGAVWSLAQRQRGDVRAMDAVIAGLQRAQSATDLAIASGGVVSGLLIQMRDKAVAAADPGASDGSRAALDADFQQLKSQITRAIESATFGGLNLVGAGARGYKVLAGLQTVATVTTVVKEQNNNNKNAPKTTDPKLKTSVGSGPSTLDVVAEQLGFGGPNVTLAADAKLTVAADLPAVLTVLDASIKNVSGALIRLGAAANAFEGQQAFIRKLQDVATAGVGQMVDADLAREGARLKALQTRQQLGIQALSIANRAPQVLTQLFRT